jgi:hypothetical protein
VTPDTLRWLACAGLLIPTSVVLALIFYLEVQSAGAANPWDLASGIIDISLVWSYALAITMAFYFPLLAMPKIASAGDLRRWTNRAFPAALMCACAGYLLLVKDRSECLIRHAISRSSMPETIFENEAPVCWREFTPASLHGLYGILCAIALLSAANLVYTARGSRGRTG